MLFGRYHFIFYCLKTHAENIVPYYVDGWILWGWRNKENAMTVWFNVGRRVHYLLGNTDVSSSTIEGTTFCDNSIAFEASKNRLWLQTSFDDPVAVSPLLMDTRGHFFDLLVPSHFRLQQNH